MFNKHLETQIESFKHDIEYHTDSIERYQQKIKELEGSIDVFRGQIESLEKFIMALEILRSND